MALVLALTASLIKSVAANPAPNARAAAMALANPQSVDCICDGGCICDGCTSCCSCRQYETESDCYLRRCRRSQHVLLWTWQLPLQSPRGLLLLRLLEVWSLDMTIWLDGVSYKRNTICRSKTTWMDLLGTLGYETQLILQHKFSMLFDTP